VRNGGRAPATLAMAEYLAPRLRRADKEEVFAASGMEAGEALIQAVRMSRRTDAWIFDDKPEAIAGVCDLPGHPACGVIWMLASDVVDKAPKRLMMGNREYVQELLTEYDVLFNFVDNRNTKAQRWLKWLGFQLAAPAPYGVMGLPFRHFWMAKGELGAARHGTVKSVEDEHCVEV
jgi:hypothetical protein